MLPAQPRADIYGEEVAHGRHPRESVLTHDYLLARRGLGTAMMQTRLGDPPPPEPFRLGDPVTYLTRYKTIRYGVVAGWAPGVSAAALVSHGAGGTRAVPWSQLTRRVD